MKFPRNRNLCHVYDLNLLPLFEDYQSFKRKLESEDTSFQASYLEFNSNVVLSDVEVIQEHHPTCSAACINA